MLRMLGRSARVMFVLAVVLSSVTAFAQLDEFAELVAGGDNPVVRFPVMEYHLFSSSFGWLYFSRQTIRFEVNHPSGRKSDEFDFSRQDFLKAEKSHGYYTRLSFRQKTPEFLLVSKSDVNNPAAGFDNTSYFLFPYLSDAALNFDQLVARLESVQKSHAPPVAEVSSKPPPKLGRLRIHSQPAGIQVYLNNEFRGISSESEGELVIGGLQPGTYRVRGTLPGYRDTVTSVTLSEGDALSVDTKLEPAGPKPLAFEEVEEALKNGISAKRLTQLVKQFGVDFALTEEVERRLRAVGADADLLLVLVKSKK